MVPLVACCLCLQPDVEQLACPDVAAVYGLQGAVQEVEEEHLETATWQHMASVSNLNGEVVAGQMQGSAKAMPGALHLSRMHRQQSHLS